MAYDEHEDDGSDERPVTLSRKQLNALEKRATDGDKATARAKTAERRLAFIEAGVDMTNPASKYFITGYDGDETTEAIHKAAEEAGFLVKPVKTPVAGTDGDGAASAPTEQDRADASGIKALVEATVAPSTQGVNHRAEMEKVAKQAALEGRNASDAIAEYMRTVPGLYVAGDDE